MPFYQQIIVALPKYPKEGLVSICRKHANTIISNGGLVRGIENHGVRPLPERARRKYPTTDGSRYFWEARYITASFDASPKVLVETERLLRNEEGILRFFTVKGKTSAERSRGLSYRNPFLKTGATDKS